MSKEYYVSGWATLAPSVTIELRDDEQIDDLSDRELADQLRYELRDMGYDPAEFSVEVDEVIEK